mgnify:CR=1 FL=1
MVHFKKLLLYVKIKMNQFINIYMILQKQRKKQIDNYLFMKILMKYHN